MALQQITKDNFSSLLRCLDPSPDLLGELLSVPFVEHQVSVINQQQTADRKNNALLNVLSDVPNDIQETVMNGFILALRSSGQEHVANIFRRVSDKVPMSNEHRRALTLNKGRLCEFIDTENGLLDELISTEIISTVNENDIRAVTGYYEKARTLLEVLTRRPDDAFGGFISALNKTRQSHVTYILTKEGISGPIDERTESHKVPMSDGHRHTLTTKNDQLCKFIDPENGLLDKLVSMEVISHNSADGIRSMPGYNEKARKLIEVLMRRSDDAFNDFINALKETGQSHVTYILTGEGESLPLSNECRDKLIEKRSAVVKSIYVDCLMSTLVSKKVFSSYDQQRVEDRLTTKGKAEMMVDLIARKSQAAYEAFIDTLNECDHEHVAAELGGCELAANITSVSKDGREIRKKKAKLCQKEQDIFGNTIAEEKQLNAALHANGISVTKILHGSIIVKFRCRDHAAVIALQELYRSKELDQLFSEAFRPKLADKGLESLSLSIPDEEFQRHLRLKLMTDEHREALLSSEKMLVDKVTVSGGLLDKLSLCLRRRQAIENSATQEQQVKTLLDIVSRQPDSAFTQFLNALKDTDQHEAATIISNRTSTETYESSTYKEPRTSGRSKALCQYPGKIFSYHTLCTWADLEISRKYGRVGQTPGQESRSSPQANESSVKVKVKVNVDLYSASS